MVILDRSFFTRPVIQVARDLLGQNLVRMIEGQRTGGVILETEAYDGEEDQACHARRGKTERNSVMYAEGGCAYVYFTYGMHWMLNCVTGDSGYPAAVLIRALLPTEGVDIIRTRRNGIPQPMWCNGPAKLTKALAIDGTCNGADLCSMESGLFIESAPPLPDRWISATPRIGIPYAPEPWRSKPWRFHAAIDQSEIITRLNE